MLGRWSILLIMFEWGLFLLLNLSEVKEEIASFFDMLYSKDHSSRPSLDDIHFPYIPVSKVEWLEEFEEKELFMALHECTEDLRPLLDPLNPKICGYCCLSLGLIQGVLAAVRLTKRLVSTRNNWYSKNAYLIHTLSKLCTYSKWGDKRRSS